MNQNKHQHDGSTVVMQVCPTCMYFSTKKSLNVLTLGGHYGKVKGRYFGNGGHYGPKRADIMVWAGTLVGADTMVHDKRLKSPFC